jgi:hypothetical protein
MPSNFFFHIARSGLLGLGIAAYAMGNTAWILLPAYVIAWQEMGWTCGDWVMVFAFLGALPLSMLLLCARINRKWGFKGLISLLIPLPVVAVSLWITNLANPDVFFLTCLFLVMPLPNLFFFRWTERSMHTESRSVVR